jgi:hypothetical protein
MPDRMNSSRSAISYSARPRGLWNFGPPPYTLKLLSEFRRGFSMARFYFPFGQLLSLLTRDQVTDEVRTELRKREQDARHIGR